MRFGLYLVLLLVKVLSLDKQRLVSPSYQQLLCLERDGKYWKKVFLRFFLE